MRCLTPCKILYINKEDFKKQFWPHTIEKMKNSHCGLIELPYIMQNIKKYYNLRKQLSQALLDATQINPVNLEGERITETIKDEGISKKQKLKPWLQNAKKNKTQSDKICREIARIEVLHVRKEKIVKNRNQLTNKYEIAEFDRQLKTKARFIENAYKKQITLIREGN